MKKILLITNNIDDKYSSITQALSNNDVVVSACSYKDLCFTINGHKSSITCHTTEDDIKEFSKIIVLATSPEHFENYIFSALSCYCHKYNIPLIDDEFSNTDGKLYALWRFWQLSRHAQSKLLVSVSHIERSLDRRHCVRNIHIAKFCKIIVERPFHLCCNKQL